MRLLNVHSFEFGKFFGANIPPYCILSHRWGEHEISYKEFRKGNSLSGPGYQKILDFCAFVRDRTMQSMPHYGSDYAINFGPVKWVWIDTCCIDKRSSAELSEAINSMYTWYRDAKECIIHLSDVSSHPLRDELSQQVEEQIERSAWFTRGWTLQELLAPSTCVFVNQTWKVIGHICDRERNAKCFHSIARSDYGLLISTLVSEITLIPQQELKHSDRFNARFKDTSVARRMSWASRRSTTRIEDEAYCLLGIFGISMPLLYGEGRQAFVRLQEEIVKRSTDQSVFAWSLERRFLFSSTILASSPKQFVLSGNIFKLRNKWTNEAGHTLANKGLQIDGRATRVPSQGYKVAYQQLKRLPGWPAHAVGVKDIILLSLNCYNLSFGANKDVKDPDDIAPYALALAQIDGEFCRIIFPDEMMEQYADAISAQEVRESFIIKAYDQYSEMGR